MGLKQITHYYSEMTAKLDELYIQHGNELIMIKELLGIILGVYKLTEDLSVAHITQDDLDEIKKYWQDVV